jgi:uroporphyrinogen decarboxylase
MAEKLTSRERFSRMYQHKEADRVPITDGPWGSTIERWHREGMPPGISWVDYFGADHVFGVGSDNSPRYEHKVIEDTEDYVIFTSSWGVTQKSWKHKGGTPEFLDFTVTDRESWQRAKERMTPSRDRINWNHLKSGYRDAREKQGAWIVGGLWFGFDITHSWFVGTERVLMALVEDPEWCMDMFCRELDLGLAALEMIWDEGYHFDEINWPEDMGYKNNLFFSVAKYVELLKPLHKKVIDWAHERGVYVRLHSCGDITPLVPHFYEIGLDALNPLEVKAGVDPIALKKKYGDKMTFHGGINAVLWDDKEAISEEIRRVLPVMKQNGGYIFASDHSIPDAVSLENFRHIISLVKEVGSYE